jgi:hypothetical protein
VTVYFPGSCGSDIDHRKLTEIKVMNPIKISLQYSLFTTMLISLSKEPAVLKTNPENWQFQPTWGS